MSEKYTTNADRTKRKVVVGRGKFREIGEKIKELRELIGAGDPITQEALGKRLGVARSQISSWEAGKEKPGADKLIALAREAPDPESLYFWQQVGIDPSEIEKAIRARMDRAGERIVFPEMSRISKLNIPALLQRLRESSGAIEIAEGADYVLLPSRFVPENQSLVCIQVPPQGAGPQLSIGDLILIDTTQRDLRKCLNCFVALLCEKESLMRGLKPEIVRLRPRGRILTERDKKEIELNRSRDPLVRAETDRRNEELWAKSLQAALPDVLFGTLRVDIPDGTQNDSHESLTEGIPWRLVLDGGAFVTPLTPWKVEAFSLDGKLALPEEPRIEILGAVIGWIRAPRISLGRVERGKS
jgi:transcriptional regulator with XRE-family HTH domain